jgi:predicted PurR-regulated permease PerM
MSAATVTVLVLIGASFVLLVVMGFGLIRAMKSLTASVRAFQRDVQPILEDIQRGAVQAQETATRVQGTMTALAEHGDGAGQPSTPGGDGRLRP